MQSYRQKNSSHDVLPMMLCFTSSRQRGKTSIFSSSSPYLSPLPLSLSSSSLSPSPLFLSLSLLFLSLSLSSSSPSLSSNSLPLPPSPPPLLPSSFLLLCVSQFVEPWQGQGLAGGSRLIGECLCVCVCACVDMCVCV
jgi:hypothetical protein